MERLTVKSKSLKKEQHLTPNQASLKYNNELNAVSNVYEYMVNIGTATREKSVTIESPI